MQAQKMQPLEKNPNPIDAEVTIGHVHLKVSSLETAEQFYVDILGFSVMARYPQALFVAAGGYHHHLGFNTWESKNGTPASPNTTGLYHVAIKYPTKRALADALKRLQDARHPIDGISDHGTQLALYLRDKEGNGVELYWDRKEDEWPLNADGTLAFSNEFFDLNELLRELDSPAT